MLVKNLFQINVLHILHLFLLILIHNRKNQVNILSLFLLKESNQVNFKCINGYHIFNSQEISEILDSIQSRRQYLFNREKEIYENIDKCISIENFVDIKYDF